MLKATSVRIDGNRPLEHACKTNGLSLLLGHDIEDFNLIVKAYSYILCLELLHRISRLRQIERNYFILRISQRKESVDIELFAIDK